MSQPAQAPPDARWRRDELSEREKEILRLVATGASNKEIGAVLDISANTVKVHLRNIFGKLGVRSRTEATMAAIEMGLLHAVAGTVALGTGAKTKTADVEASDGDGRSSLQTGEVLEGPAPIADTPVARSPNLWQRMALVLAVAVAVILAAWPPRSAVQGPTVLPDPLRDVSVQGPSGELSQEVGRWQTMAQMPSAKARFAAALSGSSLVVVGGDAGSSVTASTEVYDIGSNTWRLGASKRLPVSNVSAVALAGKIYVPGGLLADGRLINSVEIYDVAADSWQTGPPLPVAICAYGLATDGQRIYLVGGWDGRAYSDRVFALDAGAGAWTPLARLPAPRGHVAAVVSGGRLFAIGGFDGRQVLGRVDSLVPEEEGKWQAEPTLSAARAGLGAVDVSGSIYVLGGGWSAPMSFGERLPPNESSWQRWESPVEGAWRNLGVVADESAIFAVGGWKDGLLQDLYRFQAVYHINVPLVQ